MNRFSKMILAAAIVALTASFAQALPPSSYTPHSTVRVYPTTPRYYSPYIPRTTGPVIVFPTTRTLVPVVPVIPVQQVYTVYYRYSPYGPWLSYGSNYSYRHALEMTEFLTFVYGYESYYR